MISRTPRTAATELAEADPTTGTLTGSSHLRPVEPLELVAIAAGGAAGALARVGLSRAFPTTPGHWPWITFAINVLGAFLLGYLITHLELHRPLSTLRQPLLGTGFCGAFTTFSTVQIELLRMIDHERYSLAAGYALAGVVVGYLAISCASAFVRRGHKVIT